MKYGKIIIAIFVIIVAIIVILFSTGRISSKKENKNDNKYDLYSTVVYDYINALSDENVLDLNPMNSKYPYVHEGKIMEKCAVRDGYNDLDFEFEYIYYDIDKNGTDEMILYSVYDRENYYPEIINIYTYNKEENKPIKMFEDISMGYRTHANIYDNGYIFVQGSSGADSGIISFIKLEDNGYDFKIDNYFYKYEDETTIRFYEDLNKATKEEGCLQYTSFEEIQDMYLSGANIVDFQKSELKNIYEN